MHVEKEAEAIPAPPDADRGLPDWARRELLIAGVGLLLAVLVSVAWTSAPLRKLEERVGDRRMRIWRNVLEARTEALTLVTMDEDSMEALHLHWPISRGVYARVLDRLGRAGAKAVGITDVLEGPGPDTLGDAALTAALVDRTNVVLASRLESVSGRTTLEKLPFKAPVGFVDAPLDDGVVRDFFLEPAGSQEFLHCMALEVARRYFDDEQYTPRGFAGDPGSRYRIAFAGFPGTAFTGISLKQVLSGKDISKDVKGRIVLVGGSPASGEAPIVTPVSRNLGGIPMTQLELTANIVYTLVADRPLTRMSTAGLFGLVFAIVFCGFQMFVRLPAIVSLTLVFFLTAFGVLGASWDLILNDTLWPLAAPLCALGVALTAAMPYRLWLQAVSLHGWVTRRR